MSTKKLATPAKASATLQMQTHDMTLDFDGLMSILAQSLYSEKKVFIRELVQNAHDSVLRRETRDKNHRGRIEIETRPDEGVIISGSSRSRVGEFGGRRAVAGSI